ncbi:MAG TPA: hypothetical protein VKB56_12165 [Terriglobales bacterium]|nr:hypothetical protein [Terriglobales bacterium]
MLLGRGLPLLVVAALICVVAIFFHPAAVGSFVSTHGPVTSMRARKVALAVFALLIACATMIREFLTLPLSAPQWLGNEKFDPAVLTPNEDLSLHCLLRC